MSLLNETVVRLLAIAAPPVADAAEGRIYFDSTSNTFQVSQNGGAYVTLGTTTSIGWTKTGSLVRLTTTSDQVGLGTATPAGTSKLEVLGDATFKNILMTGGAPAGAATGGALTFVGGVGGTTSGVGGSVSLIGGAGTAGDSAGGAVTVQGGAGQGSALGGLATIQGGTGGLTGDGGAIVVRGGAGGGTSGPGGTAFVLGGTPVDGVGGSVEVSGSSGAGTNRNGGTVSMTGGDATGSATGGSVNMAAGNAGDTGAAGTILIVGGDGGSTSGVGGAVTLRGGVAVAGNSVGGSATVQGGAGQGSALGGLTTIQGGTGGATGNGGGITLYGGSAGAASGTGGEIIFQTALATAGTTAVERNRITQDGALNTTGIATASAPAVSAANNGRTYYDSTLQQFMFSLNGGSYKPGPGAGMAAGVVTKTANYTITQNDFTIRSNNGGGGTITMTLPAIVAAIRGQVFVVKRVNAGAGAANRTTVAAAGGETIDGAASTNLNAQYATLMVQAPDTGTDWMVI